MPPLTPTRTGIAQMILSCVCFAVTWALIRYTSETVHAFMIIFARTALGSLFQLPRLVRSGGASLKTQRLRLHLIRGITATIATFGIFYAVTVTPISLVVAISYAAPLFTTLGAVLLLGERIRIRRVTTLIIGFAAMLLVLRPGGTELTIGVFAAIAGTLGIAGSMLTIKALAPTDRIETIVAYAFFLPLPISTLAAVSVWQWPTLGEAALLLTIGITATIGQTALARAFARADASAVLPFDFVRLVLATGFGIAFFGEAFDALTLLGAVIILASTIYLAHREAQADRAASRDQRSAPPDSL